MAKTGKTRSKMLVARGREEEYGDLKPTDFDSGKRPLFKAWLRGKFGPTVADRHKS